MLNIYKTVKSGKQVDVELLPIWPYDRRTRPFELKDCKSKTETRTHFCIQMGKIQRQLDFIWKTRLSRTTRINANKKF